MGPRKLRELIDSESTFCKVFSSNKRMDPLNILRTIRNQCIYSLQNFHRRRITPETHNNQLIFYAKSTFPPKVHAAEQENMFIQECHDSFISEDLFIGFLTLGLDSSFYKVCHSYMPSFGEKD